MSGLKDEIDPVAVRVVKETEKAYFLRDKDEMGEDAWFPKSQISFERRNTKTGDAIAEIPNWLLKEKGWA